MVYLTKASLALSRGLFRRARYRSIYCIHAKLNVFHVISISLLSVKGEDKPLAESPQGLSKRTRSHP